MSNNIIKNIVIDVEATLGKKLLLLDIRPYARYLGGIKGEQQGLTFTVLSEKMNFEKVDVKVSGILKPPFEFNSTPVPVEFDGLEGKLWQDWGNKGAVRLSLTATDIRLKEKRMKLSE